MCALFGPGVRVHVHDLAGDRPWLHGVALELPAAVAPLPLLAPTVRQAPLGDTPVALRRPTGALAPVTGPAVPLALSARAVPLAWPPFATARRQLGELALRTRVHAAPELPRPAMYRATGWMRERPMLRRIVPQRLLTEAQRQAWTQRLAASKRIAPAMIELVGLFPRLPLAGDQPVQYQAQEAAIAFHLPEKPVPLSTVVVAKHRKTGEMLLGRFSGE